MSTYKGQFDYRNALGLLQLNIFIKMDLALKPNKPNQTLTASTGDLFIVMKFSVEPDILLGLGDSKRKVHKISLKCCPI